MAGWLGAWNRPSQPVIGWACYQYHIGSWTSDVPHWHENMISQGNHQTMPGMTNQTQTKTQTKTARP